MSQVIDNLYKRRCVRSFTEEEIRETDCETLLKAAIYAPTGRNSQPLFFVLLKDQKKLQRLYDFVQTGNYYGATAVLFSFERKSDNLNDLNDGAAIENTLLAAEALNLGACWIHSTREKFNTPEGKAFLKDLLGLDQEYVALDSVALGHTQGDKPTMKPRNMTGDKIL